MNNRHAHPQPMPARDPDAMEAQVAPARIEEDDFRDKLRTVLPWFASFGAHLGVLLLVAGLVTVIVAQPPKAVVVPVVSDMNNPEGPPDLQPGPPGPEGASVTGVTETLPPAVEAPIAQLPTPTRPGRGPQLASYVPPSNLHSAESGGRESGHSIFGMGKIGDGPGGPGGASRTPKRIVFLVDASGSLVDTLPFVVDDLKRLVGSDLPHDCAFNILFFSGKSVNAALGASQGIASLFGDRLEPASVFNIGKATQWMQRVEAGGSGDPLAAIKKAVAMDPEQIHVLSDNITGSGQYEIHQDRFMAEVNKVLAAAARRNGHAIQLKTYQFVYADPLVAIGKQPTLRRLVEESGGRDADYKFVTARDLGLR